MAATVTLDHLLASIRSKVESRTSRPWFDLQRNYYFKNNKTISTTTELRAALDHFHCALRETDLQLLMASFPREDGSFDFKAFAGRLYPHQEKKGFDVIRDGRLLHTLPAQYASTAPLPSSSTTSSATATSRSLDGITIASAPGVYAPPLGMRVEAKESIPIAPSWDARTTYVPVNDIYTRSINPTRRSVTTRKLPSLAHNRRTHHRYHDRGVQSTAPPRPSAQSYPDHEFRGHGQFHSLKNQGRFKMKPLPQPKFESTKVL